MTKIIFQDVDGYTRFGFVNLIKEVVDELNTNLNESSVISNNGDNTIILFRSKLASLCECTLYLKDDNIVIITLVESGWSAHPSLGEVIICLSDSIGLIKIKIKAIIKEKCSIKIENICKHCMLIKAMKKNERVFIEIMCKEGGDEIESSTFLMSEKK